MGIPIIEESLGKFVRIVPASEFGLVDKKINHKQQTNTLSVSLVPTKRANTAKPNRTPLQIIEEIMGTPIRIVDPSEFGITGPINEKPSP